MSQTSNFYPLTFVFDGWQSKLQQTLINVIFASPEKNAFVDHRCFYGEAKTKGVVVEWVFKVIEGNKKYSSDQIQFVVADGALRHYVSDIEAQSYERRQVQMWGLICQAHSVDLYMESIGTQLGWIADELKTVKAIIKLVKRRTTITITMTITNPLLLNGGPSRKGSIPCKIFFFHAIFLDK